MKLRVDMHLTRIGQCGFSEKFIFFVTAESFPLHKPCPSSHVRSSGTIPSAVVALAQRMPLACAFVF